MLGFRIVLPDLTALEVGEADGYDVADGGALALRAGGREVLRLPAGGWVEVAALGPGPPDVEPLLLELCTRLGLCLPEDAQARLRRSPPRDVDAFSDAVLAAEGLDPALHKGLRRSVRELVARHVALGDRDGPVGHPRRASGRRA